MSEITKLLEATKPFRDEIAKLQAEVEKQKKLAVGYYGEASKGWGKFRDAELKINEMVEAIRGNPEMSRFKLILHIDSILLKYEQRESKDLRQSNAPNASSVHQGPKEGEDNRG